MRRIRVTFVGFEPFWMQAAVDGLMKRYAAEFDCRWLLWPSRLGERLRFVGSLLTSDLVVRLGMPFEFESETNRFFLLMLRIIPRLQGVNYWIGSDADEFIAKSTRDELTKRDAEALGKLHHFAGTKSLQARLRAIGVPAVDAELTGPERAIPAEIPPLPAEFRVLSYWSDARFEYYGAPDVLTAARLLPDVPFDVIGTTGAGIEDAPRNVSFRGRVEDVLSSIERSVVYVRLVASDSLPSSLVEECLLLGRYVVYSMEWPHTIHVEPGHPDALVAALRDLLDRHARHELPVNSAGREFTMRDSDTDVQAALMREAILDAYAHRL